MSIRTFNKFIQGNGCVVFISIILAIFFIVGALSPGFRSLFSGAKPQNKEQGITVAVIGGNKITDQQIASAYGDELQNAQQSQALPPGPPSALDEIKLYQKVLTSLITPALNSIEIRKEGLVPSDQDVLDTVKQSISQKLMQIKFSMIESKQLSPTATDQQFASALKKIDGQTPDQLQSSALIQVQNDLKDPQKRALLIGSLGPNLIPGLLANKMQPTDAQVEASYSTLTAMRVLLTGAGADKLASKVEQLAQSGTNFATLVDQYSKDVAPKGKLPSQSPISITSSQLQTEPYSLLAGLKPGQISQLLQLTEGLAIYKIISVQSNLPPDWKKNKATYMSQYATTLASTQYQKDMQKLSTQGIDWKSKGWEALWEASQLTAGPNAGYTWSSVADLAQSAAKDTKDTSGSNAAALAYYAALSSEYNAATPAQQAKMVPQYIQALETVSTTNDSPDLELLLADLLASQKNGPGVATALLQAIGSNIDYTKTGVRNYFDAVQMEAQYSKSGLLTPALIKPIDQAKKDWLTNFHAASKQQSEVAAAQKQSIAQEAADKAAAEAAKKKAQAALTPSGQKPINRNQLNSGQPSKSSSQGLPSVLGGPPAGATKPTAGSKGP